MTNCFLLLTGALSLLSTSSHALSCIECRDIDESCIGPSVPCPKPDQVCLSVYTVSSLGGIPLAKHYIRECGGHEACNRSGSLTVPNSHFQTGTSCCYSDGCTPTKPVLPPIDNKKNGVSCKACMSTTEASCQTSEYIQCTGKEVKCISQSIASKGSSASIISSLRGCATKELCRISHQEVSFGDLTFTTDVTCSDGCAGLHLGFSLLLLAVGLIVKDLY